MLPPGKGRASNPGCLRRIALAVALDFRVMADNAHLRVPEIGLGMNMSWQSVPRMLHLIGPARTKQAVIIADESGRMGTIRADAADSAGGEKHRVGLLAREPIFNLALVGKVEHGVTGGEDVAVFARQTPRNGGARHPGVTRDVDALAGKIEQQRRAHVNLPSV